MIRLINLFSFFVITCFALTPGVYNEKINKAINTINQDSINEICSHYKLDINEYKKVFPKKYFDNLIVPNFVLLTIPKMGTHLISKVIALMLGKMGFGRKLDPILDRDLLYYPVMKNNIYTQEAANVWINTLDKKTRFYPFSHIGADHSLKYNFCIENNFKTITIQRDIRDQMISSIFSVYKQQKDEGIITNLSVEEELKKRIFSLKPIFSTKSFLFNEFERIKSLGLVVKFENLVGPIGGGDLDLQKLEIIKIANFLNISLDEQQINYICKNLWGNSLSFHKGKIGAWKNYFTKEIKEEFISRGGGKLLIEDGYEKNYDW